MEHESQRQLPKNMSNKTIWKFPLAIVDDQQIVLPKEATFLCVQMQNDQCCLWALVDPAQPTETKTIEIFGTGHPIQAANRNYIGTVQEFDGALVWHIFYRP